MIQQNSVDWLHGGGAVGQIIKEKDWSNSTLGELHCWPQSLKTALSICLCSKFPMGIWWGPEFIVFYNDAYIPIAGDLKHPMHIGRPAIEMWPEIWDVVGQLASDVRRDGMATWQEDQPLFMVRKNGQPEERYFTFSFSPARDETGAVGGMFYAVQEMTSRVIGERRLALLRGLGAEEGKTVDEVISMAMNALSKSPYDVPFAALYLTSQDEKIATLCNLFGTERGTVLIPETIDLKTTEKSLWNFARLSKSKKSELIEGLRDRFNPLLPTIPYEEKPDSAYIMPIEFAGQMIPGGFLVLGTNPRLDFNESYEDFFNLVSSRITNQILNVRSLTEEKKRSEALAEVDRAKTVFFSNVSHEFRTPLTLLLGPIEDLLAGGKGELTSKLRSEVEVVHRNALRLLKLVNTLLDFSRIEAGRVEATYVSTDVKNVTKNYASSFRSVIEKAELKYSVELDVISNEIYIDHEMWEKIVLNLLSNAFKYTLKGEISVRLKNVEHGLELSVRDTGVGIPENEIDKVFKRFHRIEGVDGRTHEGTGIGLALTEELVKLHGGKITLTSRPGEGSTFTVFIPFGKAHLPQDRISKNTDENFSSTAARSEAFTEEALRWIPNDEKNEVAQVVSGPKKHVLIADDNADMRDYVKGLLADDYEVLAVGDGRQALAAVEVHRPDLIISDVMMPVMGGIELLNELRRDLGSHTIPIILLSARAGDEAKASGIAMGADDYLTKPFSAKELLARVKTQLYMADIRKTAIEKDALVSHLADRQRWLEQVLDLIPSPLLLMDSATGQMKFANQAAHMMAGGQFPMDVPRKEFEKTYNVTDSSGKKIPPSEFPAARALRGETVRESEVVWHTPAGHFSILVNSEFVAGSEGQAPMIILSMIDVTRMKDVESELRRLIGARDEFLSVASHELKTPLTSLKLQVQMTQRKSAKGDFSDLAPKAMKDLIDLIDRQVQRLTHLVDDMLDVSRMESGNLELSKEKCDLAELVTGVVDRLQSQAKAAGVEIRLQPLESVTGNWDRFRIEQILINLLTNAFRYGEGKAVDINLNHSIDSAQIIVRDYGRGIAAENVDRIFKRFERVASINDISGLGLGLYISKQIVEAHRGSLRVTSKLGEGSAFAIELPLR